MDNEAENVSETVIFSKEEDKNDWQTHFMPKNTRHEKAMFHLRAQYPRKCVTIFVRTLYELANGYNFTTKNEEIKDRFIIELQDKWLSKHLQFTPNKVLDISRNYEQIRTQMKERQEKTSTRSERKKEILVILSGRKQKKNI